MPPSDDTQNLSPDELTRLLRAAHDGVPGALERLLPTLYDELRALARQLLANERKGHTLQPTALVHEAWLRFANQQTVGFEHRDSFFAAAATAMRRVLVDHARARKSDKRGSGIAPGALDETITAFERGCGDLLELEDALVALARFDARKAQLVELRFFAGLDVQSAASALSISQRQAERDWTTARAWLKQRLSPPSTA